MSVFVPNVVVSELKIPIFTQFDPVVIKNLFFTWFFCGAELADNLAAPLKAVYI